MIILIILFVIASVALVWCACKRREGLKIIVSPFILLDMSKNENKMSYSKYYVISFVFAAITLMISMFVMTNKDYSILQKIELSVITWIFVEWIFVLLIKIVLLACNKFQDTHDGWMILVSTVWSILGIILNNEILHLKPFLLVIVFVIVINLAMTTKYMVKMCIRREEYIKEEFGTVTTSNQLAAIFIIVAVQIANYSALVYSLVNSDIEFYLIRGGCNTNGVNKIGDVIYYVIMTYSTVGYGDIAPSGTFAQTVSCFISLTSLFTTAVIVSIILNSTISQIVENSFSTKIVDEELNTTMKMIHQHITEGKVAYDLKRIKEDDLKILKELLKSLKIEDYQKTYCNLATNDANSRFHVFILTYNEKKYYLKMRVGIENLFCISFHEMDDKWIN